MPHVVAENLVKTFRVSERRPGVVGAVAGLLNRRYRTVRALDGLTFSIEQGELVGYIGPNGAGKSTTIKVLSGILVPEDGRCTVNGRVPWQDRITHVGEIGVVFGQRTQLWWDLPVVESFELLRDIYRIDATRFREVVGELVGLLALEPLLDVPVRQLSLGQRMKCDLAASLLHEPKLLFLDEPTIGLDAVSKLALREFIRKLNRERGTTVILTTHDLDDIEALCNRVLVVNEGKVLSDGSLHDLRSTVSRERRLIVHLEDPSDECSDPDTRLVARNAQIVTLAFDPDRVTVATLIGRITSAHAIRDLFVENPPIEEIVADIYREAAP